MTYKNSSDFVQSPELIIPDISPDQMTQKELEDFPALKRNFSVGALYDSNLMGILPILAPKDVETLIRQDVAVWIESGLGLSAGFSDMDYADWGADIVELKTPVILQSNILIKYNPFSAIELELLKPNQIIISTINLATITNEEILLMERKKITAIGLNFIDATLSAAPPFPTISCNDLVLSLICALIFSYNIRGAIQTNVNLQKGIYCYQGILCKRDVSEKVLLPWKDVFTLCWDWN